MNVKFIIPVFLATAVQAAVTLTPLQRQWLDQHGKLTFAADTNYPPYTFVGADAQARGLDADVAQAIGRVLRVPVEIRPMTWGEAVPFVQGGHADVLAGM